MQKSYKNSSRKNKKGITIFSVAMSNHTVEYISGAAGGLCGLIVGHPLDTMKVLAQNSNESAIKVLNNCLKAGSSVMFRGVSVPAWSYGVVNSVMFGSYSYAEQQIGQLNQYDRGSSSHQLAKIAAAGAFAGCVQLIPSCPVEVIKIRMQYDALKGSKPASVSYHISAVLKESGLTGFYRGVSMHAMRDCTASAIYFVTYYKSMEMLRQGHNWNTLEASFVSGGLAGVLSWITTMPQDVIKTRVQSGADSSVKVAITRIMKEGPSNLFRGASFAIVRALCVNAITFLGYEMVKGRIMNAHMNGPIIIQAKIRQPNKNKGQCTGRKMD